MSLVSDKEGFMDSFSLPPSYLVRGYGETDFPEVVIVQTSELAKDAVLSLVFGPGATREDDTDGILQSWSEDEQVVLDVTFEIGGITVEKIYHVTIP